MTLLRRRSMPPPFPRSNGRRPPSGRIPGLGTYIDWPPNLDPMEQPRPPQGGVPDEFHTPPDSLEPLHTDNELLERLRIISDTATIQRLLLSIGKNALPRVVVVPSIFYNDNPIQIVPPNKDRRGVILQNAGELYGNTVGTRSSIVPVIWSNVFPLALRAPGTYFSNSLGCGAWEDLHSFLYISANAGGGTLATFLYALMTGNGAQFAPAQSDIHGGASAVGPYYEYLGRVGISSIFLMSAVVGGANMTFQMAPEHKGLNSLAGSLTGNGDTVFIGSSSDLDTTFGYPIYLREKVLVWLEENTALYAFSNAGFSTDEINLRIFELQ